MKSEERTTHHRVAAASILGLLALGAAASAFFPACSEGGAATPTPDAAADAGTPPPAASVGSTMDLRSDVLRKAWSYIPPQCYTVTRDDEEGTAKNPCYACHHVSREPNFLDDADLQLAWTFAEPAVVNPWENLFLDRSAEAAAIGDEAIDAYVATDNYFDDDGETITLARVLADVPPGWDDDGSGRWDGYVPDCFFDFDPEGFDHGPDGRETGWRVFAYYPFLGTFFPTNGSTDDVLIRLPAAFRARADGTPDRAIYEANLAIVEAVVRQTDVPIPPTDEGALGVDLDADGTLGRATVVTYRDPLAPADLPPLTFAGRAAPLVTDGTVHLAAGRYPEGTEFLHSVRYLSVGDDGGVSMAPRMKELRYMVKTGYRTTRQLETAVSEEALERQRFPGRLRTVLGDVEHGVANGQGWRLQGFIEDAEGELRPQTFEESIFCVGCHSGIGAITDGTFAFPRRLSSSAPAGGWYHWSEHGLQGLPDPIRDDGAGEYATYLLNVRGGDEFRANDEVRERFFDAMGLPRAEAFAALASDVSTLLLPSAERARTLNKAYRVNVIEQSYWRGRDAVVMPVANVHREVVLDAETGVTEPVAGPGPRVGLP